MSKLFTQLMRRKLTVGISLLVILGGGYFGYQRLTEDTSAVEYITATAERGTLVSSITGSGQVSASNLVEVKPKVSGDVIYVGVKNGQEIRAGTLIARLDTKDAQKTVRDAEVSLESAKLSLEKLKKPAGDLSVLQAENSLSRANESKQKAKDTIKKAYEDGFNTVANVFLDLPSIMTGLENMFFDNTIAFHQSQQNIDWYANQTNRFDYKTLQYKNDVYAAYNSARLAYKENLDDYRQASRNSDSETIEALILETYGTTKVIAETVKTSKNYIDFVNDLMVQHDFKIPSMVSTHQSDLASYTGTTNNHLLNLLSIKRTLEDSKEAIVNAERAIAEKTESLAILKSGPDELDVRSQELTIKQRENALQDAKEKLADYSVYAPFSGVIAQLTVRKRDFVSSSNVLATFITKQKLAEISLNEIDIAQVKVGQKTTLVFDAIEDFSITGEVAEIDTLGTVAQGVVTYNLKIAFDTQDERIKPGMTIDAAIITNRKDSIVLVPNAAIQTQGGQIFVDILENGLLRSVPVEVGLSNEISTEIISGLEEGIQVVTARLGGDGSSQTANAGQSFRIPGLGGGGGGFRGGSFQQH